MLHFQKQNGVSLIGLMIGLLVSMIAILGTLSLYKTLTQSSVDATFDSNHNGNASLAISKIASAVQNAGFGLPIPGPGAFGHISISADGSQVFWRQADALAAGSPITCSRVTEVLSNGAAEELQALPVGVAGNTTAKLLIVQTINSAAEPLCDAAGDLSAIAAATWNGGATEIVNLSSLNRLNQDFDAVALANINLINFADLGQVNCSPYGMLPAVPRRSINIQYANSQDINSAAQDLNVDGVLNALQRNLNVQVCFGNPV